MTLRWTDSIPELRNSFIERAQGIALEKLRAELALCEVLDCEARLYADIRNTGEWSAEELFSAKMLMEEPVIARVLDEENARCEAHMAEKTA